MENSNNMVQVTDGFLKFVNHHRNELLERYRLALFKCYGKVKYKVAYQEQVEDKIQELKCSDYYPTEDDSKWVDEFIWAMDKEVDF